jgi:asparagine synthase (glutamine-hydrolysing)
MSGIAGIFLLKPLNDVEDIVGRMSTAIHHRGDESLHWFKCPKTSTKSAFISVRTSDQSGLKVESSITDLRVTFSSSREEGLSKKDDIWSQDCFNVLDVHIDSNGLRIFRSLDGKCGLYYYKADGAVFFSSEKKSMWAIGQNSVDVLDPGHILTVYWDGRYNTRQLNGFVRPAIDRGIDRFSAMLSLKKPLTASFGKLSIAHGCAVLFSGGVDSALAALLTREYCPEMLLITAVCGNGYDQKAAVSTAEMMSLRSTVLKIDAEAIWNALPEVIYAIETSNRMDVEIALPFFFAAKEAKQRGIHLLISGQGPDELFAGYSRHEKLMKEQGPAAVEEALWRDVSATHEMNVQRDVRAIAVHGLDVFFPYLYPPFVRAAMSLPATLKVDPYSVPSRKIIFRELAEHLGLPSEISRAPKRATQYSSGTSKLLSSAVLERVERKEKFRKREIPSIVQDALDAIAIHFQMPVARRNTGIKLDLEPTNRTIKRLKKSTSGN